MIVPDRLIASADEIDSRLGPIPGRSSDRIARELRQAAIALGAVDDLLGALRAALKAEFAPCQMPDLRRQIEAAIAKAEAA